MERYINLISNPDFALPIVKGALFLTGLSWLILILSELIFRKAFINDFWKDTFLTLVAFPSLIEINIAAQNVFINVASGLPEYRDIEFSGYPQLGGFNLIFFPLFTVYFIAYLSHFIVRLTRCKKGKAATIEESR